MAAIYDVIVVGGGSAGAVLAARLTENPACSVLLLEAGPDYPDLDRLPTDLADGLTASTDVHDWHWNGNARGDRQVTYPRGKVTGGSSAVNGIVAIRGEPEDYDHWAALGNDEWSWEKCLPAFRKLEDDRDFGGDFHGKGGPIPVVRWRDDELTPLQAAFRDACRAAGHPDSADHNIPGVSGVGSWAMNRTGTLRISTAIGYLAPARGRLNLTIRANCTVNRVLFEEGQAIGVEVEHDGRLQQAWGAEVILCAGALHSPGILMRSGIGPASHLAEFDIPVVADVPGVGANLKDHPSVTLMGVPKPGVSSPGDPLQQMGLRFTAADSDVLNDMQMYMWNYESGRNAQMRTAMPGIDNLYMLCVSLQRPHSAGSIRLASRDHNMQPVIDINLLADDRDTARMIDGVRKAWDLMRSPTIAGLSAAVLRPTEAVMASDEGIEEFLAANVTHLVHPIGTCKMGPESDPMAVVDQHGRVRGVSGLRVVDASIMPDLPRANTNLTAIMIGERIAEFMQDGD